MQNAATVFEFSDIDGIKRRFLAINRERLRRTRESMRERQHRFLEVLPLLFHINHPSLPGFVSMNTPVGVSDYRPTKATLTSAKTISKSFDYKRKALSNFDIASIFLMGSSGTIAYSPKSDFDIWLCHRENIDTELLAELKEKADAIERWAMQLDLEVHFFLMDPNGFKDGKQEELSSESSGSAQHHLLLDEFYRTGLLLAGRYPVWWLVPPEEEHNYEQYITELKEKRLINESECVDFGEVSKIPAEEFFGAALWQLYKGIDSPYKSVLKLLLSEAYAGEYPEIDLLCQRYKKTIYMGEVDLDNLDPYIMLYRKLEDYLAAKGEENRLDLVQRCFYFKVNERLSTPDPRFMAWRREFMRTLTQSWEWSQTQLKVLDARAQWKIDYVMEERKLLVDELTHSYKALSNFARQHAGLALINQRDLNILGRKLYAAFERKAGKVDFVNPGISENLWESHLSYVQLNVRGEEESWALYRGQLSMVDIHAEKPIKRARSVFELIAWSYFNNLVDSGTAVSLSTQDSKFTAKEVRELVSRLQKFFADVHLKHVDMEDLANPARVKKAAVFINLDVDPMENRTRQGNFLTSNRTDALSYSGLYENLTHTFDLIILTSWHEVLTFRHTGANALAECLGSFFQWTSPSNQCILPTVSAFCFSSNHSMTIAQRVEEVFKDVATCFCSSKSPMSTRYLLGVGQVYYSLRLEKNTFEYRRLETTRKLTEYLGEPQRAFSPVVIDKYALAATVLPVIVRVNKPGVIQLFYRVDEAEVDVYVLDECASLFHQRLPYYDADPLLNQFNVFFQAVLHRQHVLTPIEGNALVNVTTVEFYQVQKDNRQREQLVKRHVKSEKDVRRYFNVQVIGEMGVRNKPEFAIYCDNQEFNSLEYGANLFKEVAKHVLRRRQGGQRYPIYITDIDLPLNLLVGGASGKPQTIHFLNHKKEIEARLNSALNALGEKEK